MLRRGMHAPPPPPDRDRELILYQSDYCPFCRRVTWALEDMADIEIEVRDTMVPEHRRALLELTGRTQIPCLVIDGQPMLESRDIVEWLEAYATRGEG